MTGERDLERRRRDVLAYVASIILHVAIGVLFALRVLLPSASGSAPDDVIAVTQERTSIAQPLPIAARAAAAPATVAPAT
ncbi:MAG: hypothetical protein IAI49_11975, partial [Candidatus Eremiobacteraeota bacterium]|nr:hypothetical protein [Candidatus Eremiobacteraeota bacterium]